GGGWKIVLSTGLKMGAGELLALAGIMLEGYKAVGSFSEGNIADGVFSTGAVVGASISMLPVLAGAGSVAGPIGIAVMTAFFVGQMVWQSAKHAHDGEDDVRTGLVLLGY